MRVRIVSPVQPRLIPLNRAGPPRHRGTVVAVPREYSIFHGTPRGLAGFGLDVPKVLREVVDDAKALAAVKALQAAYTTTEFVLKNLTPSSLTETFLNFTPIGLLIKLAAPERAHAMLTDWKKAALANIWKDHDRIADLRTRLWNAAKAGKLPDGTAYTWTKWKAAALNIADSLKSNAKYAVEGSVFVVATQTIADMVVRLVEWTAAMENPDKPADFPWWVWAGGGLAALGATAYVVNTFRDLLPAPHRERVNRAREVLTRKM